MLDFSPTSDFFYRDHLIWSSVEAPNGVSIHVSMFVSRVVILLGVLSPSILNEFYKHQLTVSVQSICVPLEIFITLRIEINAYLVSRDRIWMSLSYKYHISNQALLIKQHLGWKNHFTYYYALHGVSLFSLPLRTDFLVSFSNYAIIIIYYFNILRCSTLVHDSVRDESVVPRLIDWFDFDLVRSYFFVPLWNVMYIFFFICSFVIVIRRHRGALALGRPSILCWAGSSWGAHSIFYICCLRKLSLQFCMDGIELC